ncbi:amidohydrolase family protein, partial [Nocardiopsis salina]|uniref:amidohydrolase family protein n=1 Tax=Nocardiopsis salina TaxID=245836 RepID=UPI000371E386
METLSPHHLDTDPSLLVPEVLMLADGPVADHAVVVAGGEFRAVGPVEQVAREHPHLTPVRLDRHLLMPGFVDAHHHLTQSFGTSLAFGEPSEIFRRVWVPLEGALDEETAYLAAKLAALESLRGGFTTVAEAGTRAPVDARVVGGAASDAGIRCVLGRVCSDPGASSLTTTEPLAAAEDHLSRYEHHRLVHPSLALPTPDSATQHTLGAVAALARETNTVLQVHVNEHLVGVEGSLLRHGRRPLEHLHAAGALGPWLLGAHATLVTPHELSLVRETGAAISYNPVASAWKGNAVAPATTMAESGIRFGLGTDGTRGDAFRLVDSAETAQRLTLGLHTGDASCGGGWTWWDRATRLGADAVGLGAVTGQIGPGKAADFLLVDLAVPELAP